MNEPSVTVNGVTFTYRRGFPAEVRTTLAAWCGGVCQCRGILWRHELGQDAPVVHCADCHGTGRTPALGPAVVRAQPVTRVVLTDREPLLRVHGYAWYGRAVISGYHPESDLPRPLFLLLAGGMVIDDDCRTYDTEVSAHDALNAAAILWAKQQTHVPPAPK